MSEVFRRRRFTAHKLKLQTQVYLCTVSVTVHQKVWKHQVPAGCEQEDQQRQENLLHPEPEWSHQSLQKGLRYRTELRL